MFIHTARQLITATTIGLAAAGIVAAAGAGTAAAEPQVRDVGIVDGHRAFEIGSFATHGDCLVTEESLRRHRAQPSPTFATCYPTDSGWYVLSPVYA